MVHQSVGYYTTFFHPLIQIGLEVVHYHRSQMALALIFVLVTSMMVTRHGMPRVITGRITFIIVIIIDHLVLSRKLGHSSVTDVKVFSLQLAHPNQERNYCFHLGLEVI